ncbi:MAG: extracellular solute-binding protein [Clostridia bacterium]|nr:extracellular solute-binding protein [Clostridia bacterium]
MKKLFTSCLAIVLTCMLVMGTCSTAFALERDGVTLHGDSTYATIGKITDEDITLQIMLAIRDTDTLDAPSTLAAIQDLEALTGIKTEWDVIKGSDWSMKTNLMFASGDMPDILIAVNGAGNIDYEEYGVSQELVIPLDDYINEEYMPNYYGRIKAEADGPTVSLVASDGKTYSIGYLVGQYINEEGHYFINREWMNELGLQDPTTVEELTEVLRAFHAAHPDGAAYEMGLDASGYYDLKYVLPMFGVPNSDKWLFIDEDKQVKFGPVQDGFRAAVEWLHACYEEGLLDPEALSQDINTLQTKLSEGNVGFFSAWRISNMGWDNGVYLNSECIIPPSVNGQGAYMDRYLELARPCGFITAACEHVEVAVRFLDALMDTEMQADLYYGPQNATEGQGWKYNEENGKIDTYTATDITVKHQIDCNTQFFAPGAYIDACYNLAPARLEKIAYCQAYEAAGVINTYSSQLLNMVGLDADQLATFALLETDINNAVSEAAADFVAHGVTDDSWNTFVKRLNDMGIASYVETYQNALDSKGL